jgi:hypothetical protein
LSFSRTPAPKPSPKPTPHSKPTPSKGKGRSPSSDVEPPTSEYYSADNPASSYEAGKPFNDAAGNPTPSSKTVAHPSNEAADNPVPSHETVDHSNDPTSISYTVDSPTPSYVITDSSTGSTAPPYSTDNPAPSYEAVESSKDAKGRTAAPTYNSNTVDSPTPLYETVESSSDASPVASTDHAYSAHEPTPNGSTAASTYHSYSADSGGKGGKGGKGGGSGKGYYSSGHKVVKSKCLDEFDVAYVSGIHQQNCCSFLHVAHMHGALFLTLFLKYRHLKQTLSSLVAFLSLRQKQRESLEACGRTLDLYMMLTISTLLLVPMPSCARV